MDGLKRLLLVLALLFAAPVPVLAQQCGTLTSCPTASTVNGSDLMYLVQNSTSKKIVASQFFISAGPFINIATLAGTITPTQMTAMTGDCTSSVGTNVLTCSFSTLTANSTATSGFAAGQYLYSDGAKLQAGSFGSGVSTALGSTLNGPSGLAAASWAAPHVATLAALQAVTTASYPNGLWRDDYSTGLGAPPLFYAPETGTCAANSRVNDGGSCVNDAGTNSFYAKFASGPISIAEWGAAPSASASANTTAITAAEAYATSTGAALQFGVGTYTVNSLQKYSNSAWIGMGRGSTTIQLAAGVNADLIFGNNAYALFGTNSQAGIHDWSLSNLTLDGNYANETTGSGSCLVVYGYRYKLEHVTMQNCQLYGWRTAYGPYGPATGSAMEGYFNDVRIYKTGNHGVWFAGPHDSVFDAVTIINAGCTTNNASYGFFNDTNGGARFVAVHPWADPSVCTNYPAYALYDISGTINSTASHFEGAVTGAIYLGGTNNSFDRSNMYYAVTGANAAIVTIAANNNAVAGYIQDTGSVSGQVGIALNSAGNSIDVIVYAPAGLINYTGDGGLNNIRANGTTTSVIHVGTPKTSSNIAEIGYVGGVNTFFNQTAH